METVGLACALIGDTTAGLAGRRMSGLLEESAELSDSDADSMLSGEPEPGDEGIKEIS